MTRKNLAIGTFVVALAALASFATAGDLFTDNYDRTFPLAEGGSVSLENINGDVVVEVWDSPEVRVQAEKKASSQELLDALEIEVDVETNAVLIDTKYPKSRHGSWGGDRHMSVSFTLTVPRSSALDDIDLVNGNLDVRGVRGGISADCVNGIVTIQDVAGEIEVSTVNGAIQAELRDLAEVSDVDLDSVNGAVRLDLPAYANADLEAETVNGEITNGFGLSVKKGKYVGASMRGEVGGGGTRVAVETVNGRISIEAM